MQVTVIVPVHNGGDDFRICLQSLACCSRPPDQLIVVDDASTDDSAALARAAGALLIQNSGPAWGPALARNAGAMQASGDVLAFIDADVRVRPDTLARMQQVLGEHPEISALFGSYDDDPPQRSLVSRYKNLQHHYVHQHGAREASTFWSGCGAIRRETFLALGGFNRLYARPSIEDIELGARLRRAGGRIWLCPEIQATHLKRWTLSSWLRADIFGRAVPWSRLIFSASGLPRDLNLDSRSRVSAVAAWLLLLCLLVGAFFPAALLGALILLALLLNLNFDLYRFFYRRGGLGFALGSVALHALYYLYSSATFAIIGLEHAWKKLRPGAPAPTT